MSNGKRNSFRGESVIVTEFSETAACATLHIAPATEVSSRSSKTIAFASETVIPFLSILRVVFEASTLHVFKRAGTLSG